MKNRAKQGKRGNGPPVEGKRNLATKPAAPKALLDELITSSESRIEVKGVPGSGKSHLLIQRALHLVKAEGVSPGSILLLTFSNSTKRMLLARLKVVALGSVKVQTCHAHALSTVKANLALLNLDISPAVLTAAERDDMIEEAIESIIKTVASAKELRGLVSLFGRLFTKKAESRFKLVKLLKNSDLADTGVKLKTVQHVWKAYCALKKLAGKIEYSDMTADATTALGRPKCEPPKYQHLLVDEYQDCSPNQVQFIAALTQHIPNLFVVGDARQSIYGFNGSSYVALEDALENVSTYYLLESRRLTVENAALSDAVLPLSDGKTMATTTSGPRPTLVISDSVSAQNTQIVAEIRALSEQDVEAAQIGIVGRTKHELDQIERALRAAGVNVERLGDKFDHVHLNRVAWLAHQLERRDRREQAVFKKLSRTLRHMPVSRAGWQKAAKDLLKIKAPSLEGRLTECSRIYLHLLGGLRKNPIERAGINRSLPLSRGLPDAIGFRDEVRSMLVKSAVQTATIHAAKGMQWQYVFVVGATDGLLPIHYAETEVLIEDERRLMFVAVTRAVLRTRIFHCPSTSAVTKKCYREPSRFLQAAVKAGVLDLEKGKRLEREPEANSGTVAGQMALSE